MSMFDAAAAAPRPSGLQDAGPPPRARITTGELPSDDARALWRGPDRDRGSGSSRRGTEG